ncbi:cell division protein [Bifidobacterium olomucense]|uniref:Cell division protein n=1 Tax=Bifidobacterium olomucense TaxID=2675324 RepID=A0A7Y0EYX7_9BIFI|nr:cell division protein [Bifidobacterium sp. DSM 109959]NMM98947.1 cell division protein [Bifidobacterium sp. DSM 109959]
MSDEHPTGYVDLTGLNSGVSSASNASASGADSAPMPATAEQPNGTAAADPATGADQMPEPAPTEQADIIASFNQANGSEPPAPANAARSANASQAGTADAGAGAHSAQATSRASFRMDSLPDLRESVNLDSPEEHSREEFTTVYDILDQMETTLAEAKTNFLFPGTVRVDRDEFTAQLDELKKMLPVQLERASALMREAERRLESAQTQSNAIVASAQSRAADMIKDANEQAQFLAGQENVTELARQKARAILDQAQSKADHLTQGADQYCTTVMEGLSQQLGKLSQDVQAGLNVLEERQRIAGEQLPHLTLNDYPEAQ